MPRAKKVCSHLDPDGTSCPNTQPCPDHQRKPWQGSTRRTELPPDWERRRRSVLARDPVCTVCLAAVSTEVHHVKDKHDHSMANLSGICNPCHKDETAKQSRKARVG